MIDQNNHQEQHRLKVALSGLTDSFLAANRELSYIHAAGLHTICYEPLPTLLNLESHNLSGLITEPIPNCYSGLQELYSGFERITIGNFAIDPEYCEKKLWRFMPSAIKNGKLNPLFADIILLRMEELTHPDGRIGKLFNEQQRIFLKTFVEPITIQCHTLENSIKKHNISNINLLHMNAGENNHTILKTFNFTCFFPEIVYCQQHNISEKNHQGIVDLLTAHKYEIHPFEQSILALHGIHPTLKKAYFLQRDQPIDHALIHYQHILATEPDNMDALHWSAKALANKNSIEEMLDIIVKIKTLTNKNQRLDPEIEKLAIKSVSYYNTSLNAGKADQAINVMEALIKIFPDNTFILETALTLFYQQKRSERLITVSKYLLAIDPTHTQAYQVMKKWCLKPSYIQHKIDTCITNIRMEKDGTHPALRLQNIYWALSAMLFSDVNHSKLALINELIVIAQSIISDSFVPESDRLYTGYLYYRSIINMLNIQVVMQPVPPALPWPAIEMSSSTGQVMNQSALRQMVEKQQPEVVFFVAADPVYVTRHARRYISTIFNNCDVPYMIVIHVIGGMNRLGALAQTIGIDDSHLVLSADTFNPATIQRVTCSIVATAPTCQATRDLSLVVNYQSARFLWLGYMLEQFSLPVIVTDIDQLLQRGVRDMLTQFARTDVVLHETFGNDNMADRLVANLLLVKPTDNGKSFAQFLRHYLNLALQQAEKEGVGAYFLDQIALLMARQHLSKLTTATVDHFGQFDINLAMYEEYKITPFRFFSLYSNFDMDSLPV